MPGFTRPPAVLAEHPDGRRLVEHPLDRWPDPGEAAAVIDRLAPLLTDPGWTWQVRPPNLPCNPV